MDLYGAGKVMEKVGDVEKSVQFFKKALDGKLSDEVSVEAKKKISYHFKKNQDWEKAVLIWKEMISAETASMSQLLSFRELAMYLEHKEKKFEEAREVAEEGFVMSMGFSSYYEKDFAHRRERLKQKIRQQKEKDAEPKKKQSAKKQSMKKQTKIKQPIKKQSKTKAKGK
jgi:tetratricopeptide (TPR) repeat protein